MKILLIGKTSQVGSEIFRSDTGHEVAAPGRAELDIRSGGAVDAVLGRIRPDVVINTAAFQNVPLCETEPDNAFMMNCISVRNLAAASRRANALFVTLSTDYVFNGDKRASYTEDDNPGPLQVYGITRLAGEYAALSAAPDRTVIIRSCGLFGSADAQSDIGNFVDERVQDAKSNRLVQMGSDQIVSPTYTRDLGKAIMRLIDHPGLRPGVYHLVNEGKCSWYEFTKAIYDIMGVQVSVKPIDRSGMTGTLRRPLYSALLNMKARELGIVLPHWRDALERYLRERQEAALGA